ncbi:VWFA-related domain-containing protein [Bryocella elongata]|uniref:VWFA-related domain-containing protein n=1 Tax=Bryocella elongata TaxID=863522 RepID=A0A1H6B193_9BACT|nr:VWFA-related domain-containing protein [Bryocella elongata]
MRSVLSIPAIFLWTLSLAAQSGNQPAPPVVTLHAAARLVVVDVTVTDAHGNPVRHLPESAFHLAEGGRPQILAGMEEHSAASDAAAAARAGAGLPPLQPGVFTNLVPPPQTTPTILLFDALNTPASSQGWVRRQVMNYLRTAPPNTRIAIFGLNSQLVLLQNFTTDIGRLRAAMAGVHPQGAGPGDLDVEAPSAAVAQIHSQLMADQPPVGPGQEGFLEQALSDFVDIDYNVNEAQRATITLRAFHQIALFLAGVPGRKNLIWFSGGFPLSLIPPRTPTNYTGEPTWKREYRETMDLLARERIAIYPVDAHGLDVSGASSSERMESQSAMYEMADDSGGKAFMNTNGVAQAVAQVVSSGSDYYTLAYVPSDKNAHGEYRKIRVAVDAPTGLQLSYRRGYYAEPAVSTAIAASDDEGPSPVRAAAAYLAPPATQIQFFARVLPSLAGVVPVADSTRRQLDPTHNRRYGIEYSADVRSLDVETLPDGRRQSHLEFVSLVYDPRGRVIRSDVKSLHMTWTPEQWVTAVQRGARYQQEISLPAEGTSLRLIIHDLENGHLGSLDVSATGLEPNSARPPK